MALLIFTSRGAAADSAEPAKPVDYSKWSGRYTFNPTDTDETAVVIIKIRRPTKDEGGDPTKDWRVDGVLEDGLHGIYVKFSGAYGQPAGEETFLVSAQFFGFTLNGTSLEWEKNYERSLEKDTTYTEPPPEAEQSEKARDTKPTK